MHQGNHTDRGRATATCLVPATEAPPPPASLNFPGGIVLDSAGTVFIVDSVNQRIRKVSGGSISTIAGTGATGFAGDNGAALQAQFNNPFPITLDSAGNLYVGDIGNNRVPQDCGALGRSGPTITSAGVTNAASFQTGIAPGGIITIFGANLGAAAGQILTAPGAPWPRAGRRRQRHHGWRHRARVPRAQSERLRSNSASRPRGRSRARTPCSSASRRARARRR